MNIVSLTYSSNENLREKPIEVHKMAKKKIHIFSLNQSFIRKEKQQLQHNKYGGNMAQSLKPQSR